MANFETSAIDVMYNVIIADNPAAVGFTFKGFTPDKEGLVRELTEDTGDYKETFAPGVAIEQPICEVGIRGLAQDYVTPRNEAIKLRRLLSRVSNYVLNDIRILRFEPIGGIIYEGRDDNRRVMFTLRFKAHMEVQ